MSIENFYRSGYAIYRGTKSKDAVGAPVTTWAFHIAVEGKLWQLNGDERLSADKETYFADHKFACDILDITELDRLVDDLGNTYDIKAVAERTRPDGTGHMELSLELRR